MVLQRPCHLCSSCHVILGSVPLHEDDHAQSLPAHPSVMLLYLNAIFSETRHRRNHCKSPLCWRFFDAGRGVTTAACLVAARVGKPDKEEAAGVWPCLMGKAARRSCWHCRSAVSQGGVRALSRGSRRASAVGGRSTATLRWCRPSPVLPDGVGGGAGDRMGGAHRVEASEPHAFTFVLGVDARHSGATRQRGQIEQGRMESQFSRMNWP